MYFCLRIKLFNPKKKEMAKAAWLTVAPMSGTGNATITNTGTVHTGRKQRTTTVTGTATGVSPNKTYTVVQKAKPEFISFNNGVEITVQKQAGHLLSQVSQTPLN